MIRLAISADAHVTDRVVFGNAAELYAIAISDAVDGRRGSEV